jgi:hypothetical protein
MNFSTVAKAKKQAGVSYLGSINSSAKIIKNQKVSNNYTYILYLAPASTSGYNVCLFSTPECRLGCLATSGRASIELHTEGKKTIQNARILKTKLFMQQQEFFMKWLVSELEQGRRKALKDGYEFSVRLNGTSDIDWQKVKLNGKNIFEIFPDVTFYDYTKSIAKMYRNVPNYHLTFSYSGHNSADALELLGQGYNVAVVFDVKKGKPLPETFVGHEVVDGDLTDARFTDPKGCVVGLRWKKIADKDAEKQILNSVFVVKV